MKRNENDISIDLLTIFLGWDTRESGYGDRAEVVRCQGHGARVGSGGLGMLGL